jgi:hypothetical protein
VFREQDKRIPCTRAVAMMLAYLLPVAPSRMTQEKRALSGPPLCFRVRPCLGLQLAFDSFSVFFVSGFGIA